MNKVVLLFGVLIAVCFWSCETETVENPQSGENGIITTPPSRSGLVYKRLFDLEAGGMRTGDEGLFYALGNKYYVLYMGAALVKVFNDQGKFEREFPVITGEVAMSTPGAIIPMGPGQLGILDLSDHQIAVFDTLGKFQKLIWVNINKHNAGSILESAAINPLRYAQHIVLPMQPPSMDMTKPDYYSQPVLGLFTLNGELLYRFGGFPDPYRSKEEVLFATNVPHFYPSGKRLFVSYEGAPEIHEYELSGKLKHYFGENYAHLSPAPGLSVGEEANDSLYNGIRDSSNLYFQISHDSKSDKVYRMVLLPKDERVSHSRVRRFERKKLLQVFNADRKLEHEFELDHQIIGLTGFKSGKNAIFYGYDVAADTWFVAEGYLGF